MKRNQTGCRKYGWTEDHDKCEDDDDEAGWMEDGDIAPNERGDGRVIRKRLEE